MKKWVVEFSRTDFFSVEVEAETEEQAEEAATKLVREDTDSYFLDSDGLDFEDVYEVE